MLKCTYAIGCVLEVSSSCAVNSIGVATVRMVGAQIHAASIRQGCFFEINHLHLLLRSSHIHGYPFCEQVSMHLLTCCDSLTIILISSPLLQTRSFAAYSMSESRCCAYAVPLYNIDRISYAVVWNLWIARTCFDGHTGLGHSGMDHAQWAHQNLILGRYAVVMFQGLLR